MASDLTATEQRYLDRVIDRAGAANNWVAVRKLGAISVLESLVDKGYLASRVAYPLKGAPARSYRLRKEQPNGEAS